MMKFSTVKVDMIEVGIALEAFDDVEEILHLTNDVYPELRVAPNHVSWAGVVSDDKAEFNIIRDDNGSMLRLVVKNLYNEDTPDVQSFFWEMQMNAEDIDEDEEQSDDLHHFIMNQIEIRGWSDETKKHVLEIYNDVELTLLEAVGRVLEIVGGDGI